MEVPSHQFDDVQQQEDSVRLGMWIFLATEVLFFGAMFLGYAVYRNEYSAAFAEASRQLNISWGTLNTAVLLCSSLTVALGIYEVGKERRSRSLLLFSATVILGLVFLAIKFYEYYQKYEEHLIPGTNFEWKGSEPSHASMFFLFYFVMTGAHALHMIIGIGVLSVLAMKIQKGRFENGYVSPVEVGGLYWHFVDAVWVFLFPLLYLVDRSR